MTAPDDGWRRHLCEGFGCDQPRLHPSVESGARKQPTSSDLGAWHRLFRDKLVKLALGKAQVSCGLVGGQQVAHASICAYMQMFTKLTIPGQYARQQAENRIISCQLTFQRSSS